MTALDAVQPHGVGRVDLDRVGWDHAHAGAGGGGLEARVEACDVGVHGNGLAGRVKVGLRHGVVAREELELHEFAGVDADVVGREGQGAVARDLDDGCSLRWGGVSEMFQSFLSLVLLLFLLPSPKANVPEAMLARAARTSVENCILAVCVYMCRQKRLNGEEYFRRERKGRKKRLALCWSNRTSLEVVKIKDEKERNKENKSLRPNNTQVGE